MKLFFPLCLCLFLLSGLPLSANAEQGQVESPAVIDIQHTENKVEKDQPKPFSSKILKPKTSPQLGSAVVSADPITVVAGLLLVIGLIFFVAWLLRRLGALPAIGTQTMRVVATLPLSAREKAVLVDVGGQQLLLGVAPGRVTHLHSFEQSVVSNNASQSDTPKKDFSGIIKKLIQHNTDDQPSSVNKKAGD